MLSKDSKIYIAGHRGMVGSACWRVFEQNGYHNLVGKSSAELDLRNREEVTEFLSDEKPYAIIDAAAKVGGILANDTYPYEFLLDNMLIQNSLINAAHALDIQKFIFLGSSCIYPKFSAQPIKEEYLLTDSLEPTNQWYAVAKITGVKLIESLRKQYDREYVSLMPTNLYGPNDNFDLKTSHVLPALIQKFHEARQNEGGQVTLWGTGTPKREFLHVDDLARAVLMTLEKKLTNHLYNVGTGSDLSIKELAELVSGIIEFKGELKWDTTKPDGTPRKLLDTSRIQAEGWSPAIELKDGIIDTYNWFKNNQKDFSS